MNSLLEEFYQVDITMQDKGEAFSSLIERARQLEREKLLKEIDEVQNPYSEEYYQGYGQALEDIKNIIRNINL